MAENHQVQTVCRWTSHGLVLAIVLSILTPIIFWMTNTPFDDIGDYGAASLLAGHEITLTKRFLGLGITLFPIFFLSIALGKLRFVFGQYAQGQLFEQPAIDALRSVGLAGIGLVLAQGLATPLMSLAMTYDFEPGYRTLTVSIGGSPTALLGFFAALMFVVLAWVLDEARQNSEDLAMIV
ncbi:MAG: hypothetical protein COA47_12040 [Robiginitomaculum sp.]|nr:MAG: hypothetical protein COA47_12040 [Robiginitomaculum sp.]